MAGAAEATTVYGIDFTNVSVIDVAPGASLSLATSDDIYIFVPNQLQFDSATIEADQSIVIDAQLLGTGAVALCAPCVITSFDVTGDVLVRIFAPISELTLRAGGDIAISTQPIPEPSTALLVGAGLLWLARARGRTSP